MDTEFLITQGNEHRAQRRYTDALRCYLLAAAQDPASASAFNNYGNVLRELGHPDQARPWLEHALRLVPDFVTAEFNLAVAALLEGDYARGWPLYESRWRYEHLSGTLPDFPQPRWQGEDLRGRRLLVLGEQGHGDCIQMSRFLWAPHRQGAEITLVANANVLELFRNSTVIRHFVPEGSDPGDFDFWIPMMSLPGVLGVTLENLPPQQCYLNARADIVNQWQGRLGPKQGLRVALAWRGRPDSWLNQHKGVAFPEILRLIQAHPRVQWHCVQMDATDDEQRVLADLGVRQWRQEIGDWADTAGLVHHCDVVISADTALAHLGGALGRPTWIMLNRYAQDWRWLQDRADSAWYATVRLFRQPQYDAWAPVVSEVSRYLGWFKV
jgi:hypothetical protein